MSKSSTRTTSKTNPKNEVQRRISKSPATSVPATSKSSNPNKVKQQDSLESEKSGRKIKKIAIPTTKETTSTHTTTSSRKAAPLHTSKNKERETISIKRTTPSPTTKATSSLRVGKQEQQQPPGSKAKPNAVLDTYHSVTVSSPPPKRKQTTTAVPEQEEKQLEEVDLRVEEEKQLPRARTYSRTLQPDEIVVLKRDSAKQRSELQVQHQLKQFKQPVAFEVNFEAAKKLSQANAEAGAGANESDNYSDDFESYESDFETDASTPEEEEEANEEEQEDANENEEKEESKDTQLQEVEPELNLPAVENFNDDDEEDSEPTQNPITVIHRDKEVERKLDSGHYDMNSRRQPRAYDSFDTNSMANSDQLDSGISSYGTVAALELPSTVPFTSDVHYGGYVDFVARPVITRRGLELMRKLRFDQLEYQLFEMKPLSYEGYMQSYGKLNTCQLATQTHSQHMNNECQTVELHTRTSWTQHPPHYGGQLVLNCSGDAGNEGDTRAAQTEEDVLESSLAKLEQLRRAEQQRSLQQQRQRLAKPNDLERLGVFLHKASLLLGKVLNTNLTPRLPNHVSLLQTGLLNALRVRRIFGSAGQQQLVVTVHECPPQSDVYRDDFANLLMVWSLTDPSKPLRLLSTWAEVCRVAFCSEAPDIIIAGLRDGSVAMWDLRETYSYCSKLDGHLSHFAATQSVIPCLDTQQQEITALDLGAVVDVRSFRPAPRSAGLGLGSSLTMQHKDIQYATLNDSGLLTIWTLVETTGGGAVPSTNEYSSPWARVKLLQAASCDLRVYLERRLLKRNESAYDKTKSLFQGNVYNDELLRELNETQTLSTAMAGQGLEGLRFSGIDTGSDFIYVCTNRNFVLCCTRSLKPERFMRIGLHESRFLFPTALCVLTNEHFIAVGLSNGSVIILNCNQRQRQRLQRPTTAMPHSDLAPVLEPETGKSCAIQNIILNERRSFEQQDLEGGDERPNTALELLQQPRRAYELRVFDQQLLLSGSALRQHLVQGLVQSNNGWRLFALSNGTVRTYDFHLDRELADTGLDISSPVTDIAAACNSLTTQKLLVLEAAGEVRMHSLNS